jgi:hypothetical protein
MSSTVEKKVSESALIPTIHWVLHTELTLDYPAREVWPVFRDMRRWYTEYAFEVVSGPSYRAESGLMEDQVLKMMSSTGLPRTPNTGDVEGPHYYIVKIIKVVPQKEIVSLLSGSAYDWRQYTSFYVWKLHEMARQTIVLIDTYGEAEFVKPLLAGDFSDYQDRLVENWHRSWSEAFVGLKQAMGAPT